MLNWLKAWLVSSLKDVVVSVVQVEGDKLQAKLRAQVAGEKDACRLCDKFDKVIDEAQRRTLVLVASKGPAWAFLMPVRDKIAREISVHGDKLQEALRNEIKAKGPAVLDKVFDSAQAVLIGRIKALKL